MSLAKPNGRQCTMSSLSSSAVGCSVASDGERAVPSMPFCGATANKGLLSVLYTVCTSSCSHTLLINMSRRSQELALDTTLPGVLSINPPAKWEVDRMIVLSRKRLKARQTDRKTPLITVRWEGTQNFRVDVTA